ncbi:MAG: hypothetical protein M1834_000824 [Cirrosporium novae-zelandiae]|nr:MAG: hypothetical protein M1834_000824 [Cirrosporium novae-zelandiae]
MSICWSCRLQLLQLHSSRAYHLQLASYVRSNFQRRRLNTSVSAAVDTAPTPPEHELDDSWEYPEEDNSNGEPHNNDHNEPDESLLQTHELIWDKKSWGKHLSLERPRTDSDGHELPFQILGKQAEFLVIRDENKKRGRPRTRHIAEKPKPALTKKISALLVQNGREDLSFQEHLEEIRSAAYKNPLTPAEWKETRKLVYDSFSNHQLKNYLRNNPRTSMLQPTPSKQEAKEAEGEKQNLHKMYVRATEWHPGITTFGQPRPSIKTIIRKANHSRDLTGKMATTERIMRQCWELYPKEEAEGELEITVGELALGFLLQKTNTGDSFLSALATRHYVKIDVSKSQCLIRITASEDVAELVCEEIKDAIGRIAYKEVKLSSFSRKMKERIQKEPEWEEKVKQTMSAKTGTMVTFDKRFLTIHYMGPSTREADDALKILLQDLFRESSEVLSQVLWATANMVEGGALKSIPVPPSNDPSNERWYRVANQLKMAASSPNPFYELETPEFEPHNLSKLLGVGELPPKLESTLRTRVTAILGQVLHPRPPDAQVPPNFSIPSNFHINTTRSTRLYPNIPYTPRLLRGLSPSPTPTTSTTYINLLHNPTSLTTPKGTPKPPPITLTVSMTPQPRIIAAEATLVRKAIDLLLPDYSTDIRLLRELYLPLDPSSIELSFADSEFFNIDPFIFVNTPAALVSPKSNRKKPARLEYFLNYIAHTSTLHTSFNDLPVQFVEAAKTARERAGWRVLLEPEPEPNPEFNPDPSSSTEILSSKVQPKEQPQEQTQTQTQPKSKEEKKEEEEERYNRLALTAYELVQKAHELSSSPLPPLNLLKGEPNKQKNPRTLKFRGDRSVGRSRG